MRGFESGDSDIFGVALDTFHDRRNAFMFLVNPRGAVKDAQDFDRKNEEAYWAPLDRRDRIHRMSKAGTLEGLQDLRAGRNLTIKPYALGANLSGRALTQPAGADFNAFGDISERSLRLGASLSDFTLFHSRRIGLTFDGQPLPILGGGRLTGKARGFELGLLNIQTRGSDRAPAENFAAVRVRKSLAGYGDAGVLFLNREATETSSRPYNRSFGADLNLRFLQNLVVNSYFAATEDPIARGSNTAARLTVGWRDRFWDASAFVKQVGDGFEPRMGFVRRRDMRHSYATLGIHPRPHLRFIQELNPYIEVDYITNLRSVLETRNTTLGFDVPFQDGGRFGVTYNDGFERLADCFSALRNGLAGGVVVAARHARGREP